MLEFGNKEFRNLQEQVGKNQEDILKLKQGGAGHEPVPGPQGEQGPQGQEGQRGKRGHGIYGCSSILPSASAYEDGDMYLLFNGELHKKVVGEWKLQTSLKGARGPVGDPGDIYVYANPAEEASDYLNKIKINDVVYEVGISPENVEYINLLKQYATVNEDTGKVTFGQDVEVDGKLQVNEFDLIEDKHGTVLADYIETKVDVEKERAESAESSLQVMIEAEETARQEAIENEAEERDAAIAAERTRAMNAEQAAIQVAEGKVKSLTIDSDLTGIPESDFSMLTIYTNPMKTHRITTWAEFCQYVGSNNPVCVNNVFNSTNASFGIEVCKPGDYIMIEAGILEYVIAHGVNYTHIEMEDYNFRNGDVFYVVKSGVPDRWIDYRQDISDVMTFRAFDADSPDLENVAKTNQENTFSEVNTFEANTVHKNNIEFDGASYGLVNRGIKLYVTSSDLRPACNFRTNIDNAYSLGISTHRWKELYVAGKISDGTNEVTVASIATTDTEQTFTGVKHFNEIKFNKVSIKGSPANDSFVQIGSLSMYLGSNSYINTHFMPGATNTYNIGSENNKWTNLYMSGTIKIGNTTLNESQLQALLALLPQ